MKVLLNNLSFVLISIVLFSCTSSSLTESSMIKKRRYNKGWHVDLGRNHGDKGSVNSSKPDFTHALLMDTSVVEEAAIQVGKVAPISPDSSSRETETVIPTEVKPVIEDTIETKPVENKCDTIVFNNGKRILAKVNTVDKVKVTYKLCNNLDGPDFSHETSLVNKLQFADGSEVVVSDYYDVSETNDSSLEEEVDEKDKKNEIFSLLSFLLFVTSPFLVMSGFALLTIPLALIFGIVGLFRLKRNPEKYKGLWMALTGIIGAGLTVLLMVAAIVIVLAAFGG